MILDVTSASSEKKRVVEAVYSTIVDTLVSGMGAQLDTTILFCTVRELYRVLFNVQRSSHCRGQDFFHSLTTR